MSQFEDSIHEDGQPGRSFLSLLGITAMLLTAGISLAVLLAGA